MEAFRLRVQHQNVLTPRASHGSWDLRLIWFLLTLPPTSETGWTLGEKWGQAPACGLRVFSFFTLEEGLLFLGGSSLPLILLASSPEDSTVGGRGPEGRQRGPWPCYSKFPFQSGPRKGLLALPSFSTRPCGLPKCLWDVVLVPSDYSRRAQGPPMC